MLYLEITQNQCFVHITNSPYSVEYILEYFSTRIKIKPIDQSSSKRNTRNSNTKSMILIFPLSSQLIQSQQFTHVLEIGLIYRVCSQLFKNWIQADRAESQICGSNNCEKFIHRKFFFKYKQNQQDDNMISEEFVKKLKVQHGTGSYLNDIVVNEPQNEMVC